MNQTNAKKCPKTKKRCFPDQAEAERQLALVQFFGYAWHKEKRVYQCAHCGAWHLTSQDKRKRV